MEVIVPAAGLSSRFPNMKPKYLLRDDSGEMMLRKAIGPYLNHNVTVGILQDHVEQFQAKDELMNEFGDAINIVVIPKLTKGPADTVFQIIKLADVNTHSEFLIKDCDSYFEHDVTPSNYVAISQVADHEVLINLASKSFVITNEQGIITDIIEKKVVSDKFCVGGYKFESVKLFTETFEKINKNIGEIFVSHVIEDCLLNDHIFVENLVSNYYDVGTAQDWKIYNESLSR